MKRKIRLTESQLNLIIKTIIQEDAVLLKKLVLKSVINFGKYKGQTVEEILRLGKRSYLRFVYYNINGLSFVDDILKNIGIFGEKYDYRIEKPGTNPEFGKKLDEYYINHLPQKMCYKVKSHNKKIQKGKRSR